MTLYIDTRPALEWVEYNGRHMAGDYEIKQTPNEKWQLTWTIDHDYYHDTLDEAKAAAQADYEARTAERFIKLESPPYRSLYEPTFLAGWDACLQYINAHNEAIAKATTPESLHTKP